MLFGTAKPYTAREGCLLAAITFLGAGLRFYGLDRESFWYDEFITRTFSFGPDLATVWANTCHDVHPPAYPLLAHAVIRWLGDDEFWLRLPSAIFGTLSIPLIFLVAKRLYDARTGLAAALFTAVLWCPVYYSQEARNYALLLLLVLGATACWLPLMEALRKDGRLRAGPALGYAVLAAGVCYTHYFGLMLIVLQGALSFALLLKRRETLLRLLAVYGLAVLLYAPWLPVFYDQFTMKRGHMPFFMEPRIWEIFYCYRYFFNQTRYLLVPLLPLYLFLALWSWHSTKAEAKDRSRLSVWLDSPGFLLVLWAVVPVALMWVKSHLSQPLFENRYFVIVMPALYILLARAVMRLPLAAWLQSAAAALLGAIFLAHLLFKIDYYTVEQKEPFRQAVAWIAERDRPGPETALVAYYGVGGGTMFDYYFERLGSPRRVDLVAFEDEDLPKLKAFLDARRPRRVWVLFLYGEQPGPAILEHLQARMVQTEYKAWEHPRKKPRPKIWLFERRD